MALSWQKEVAMPPASHFRRERRPKQFGNRLASPLLAVLALAPGCETMEQKTEGRKPPNSLVSAPAAKKSLDVEYKSIMESVRANKISKTYEKVMEYLSSDAPKEYRSQLFDAFVHRYGKEDSASSLFRFISESSLSKQKKYQIMDHFIESYGPSSLPYITMRAYLDLGLDFTKTNDALGKETMSYIQCLGYGMTRFGPAGFIAAEKLLETMDKSFILRDPLFSKRQRPLSELLIYMVTEKLAKEGKIDASGTITFLSEKYLINKEGKFDLSSANLVNDKLESEIIKINISAAMVIILNEYANQDGGRGEFITKLLENPNLKKMAREALMGIQYLPKKTGERGE